MSLKLFAILLAMPLAAPEALAREQQQPRGPRGQQPPRTQIQQQETDVKKLCERKALEGIVAPKVPTNQDAIDLTAEIPEGKENELKFDKHCLKQAGGTARVEGCDVTLGRAFVAYYRARRALEGELKKVCEEMEAKVPECQKQSETLKCTGEIYRHVAAKFNEVKARLDKDSAELTKHNALHKSAAELYLTPKPRNGAATAPASAIRGNREKQIADQKLKGEAHTGQAPVRASNQDAHTSTCATQVRHLPFCSHITAAADAQYYKVVLNKAADVTGSSATRFTELANRTQGPGSGDPDGDKKSGGLLDSVGGLDGLMKMATIGMMGAGMYCQMSGQCGNQNQSALPTDPAANAGLGATSPTPSSANNGPQSSPLESTDSKSGGSTPPSADFKTATDTDTGPSFAGPGGSGFSSEPDGEALRPFNGDLNRAPATASAPTGGGLGGGNDSSGASAPPAADPNADAGKGFSADSGLGPVGGGGGLPAAGGFSLSSSPDAPAADSALKDILNGDAPADSGLASLGDDLGAAGSPTEQGDIDLQGAESLFFRVRDTHVRCVKRGCVGREVGEKI